MRHGSAAADILIACIGNIFLEDDAFGVEVARRLAARPLPEGVRVENFGIRGFDLAFALMEEREATILVDALPRGKAPGTLYVLDPALDELGESAEVDGHGLDPVQVLRLVQTMGGQPGTVLVVGCEPATLETEDGDAGLSPSVAAAVDGAVELIESLLAGLLRERRVAKPVAAGPEG